MRQECVEEVKNPSSADLEVQLQKAALLISEMEDEPPLLSAQAALKGGAKWFGSGRQGPGQGPASASAKSSGGPKATRARKGDNPAVAAAQFRAKTAKDFTEVEKSLDRAYQTSNTLLEDQAWRIHEQNPLKVEEDISLNLVRSRQRLVKLALDKSEGPEGREKSTAFFEACKTDPYLTSLSTTTLADPEGCQTMGFLKHNRFVTLDLYLA